MSDTEKLATRIKELTGWSNVPNLSIVTDTSDCMRIQRGNVVRIDGHEFIILGNKYETRFGIEYQPKYWVFSAVDVQTGEHKILKTVFYEDFTVHVGVFRIHCYRSPEKEAKVLELVKGDSRFMQGYTVYDEKQNNVRVLDYIRGKTIFNYVYQIEKPHEAYYYEDLPAILHRLTDSLRAIAFLHEHGTCHGDVRNDHIIIEEGSGQYRWIDFDLNQHVSDFDLWSLGNVINYVVGKGINSFQNILRDKTIPVKIKESLTPADASAFYEYRLMNLQKLYPYISPRLNNILMHFSIKPAATYTSCTELINEYIEMSEKDFPSP